MKKFKELVSLLGKRHLPIDDTKLGRQANALYLYIRRVATPTDQGAAKKLKLSKSSPAYRKVKHKLKYALLDGITAVSPDTPSPESRPEASLLCWSSIALARSNPYAYDLLPRKLIDANIQLSQEYDLLEASSLLTDVLADRPSVGPDIVHYLEQSDYLGELGVAMAELYDASFYIAHLRNSQESFEKIRAIAFRAFEKMLPRRDHFKFILWHYHLFVLEINFYLAENNFVEVLRVSNDAIDFLVKREELVLKDKYLVVFKINRISSFLQLCEFRKGEIAALELLNSIPEDSRNYYKVQELLMFLCLRTGNFQKGYDYFKEYKFGEISENIDNYFSETILIFEAYIFLGVTLKQIRLKDGDVHFIKFRVGKFLNNFEFVTKEKGFRNIQVVILRLLFNLLKREKGDFDFKNEFADKYIRRHLTLKSFNRSRLFISGILYLGNQGINIQSASIAYKRYIRNLDKFPFQEVHQDSYNEVVQYERLWSLILDYYNIHIP
ncbi:hypothetical protein [Neolewinella persica]|uniref:hypothetical protein n=1 Tax=Neolewinella persica TaxID=70998 RepID=UPI00036A8C3D|nr:hypothetical protein [Neolewinella persica]